jgi:hypothetical protein
MLRRHPVMALSSGWRCPLLRRLLGSNTDLLRKGTNPTLMTKLGHQAALFVAMHATETVRPAIVSPRLALGIQCLPTSNLKVRLLGWFASQLGA